MVKARTLDIGKHLSEGVWVRQGTVLVSVEALGAVWEIHRRATFAPGEGCGPVAAAKMHDNQIEMTTDLVRPFLATQFPLWSDLPSQPVQESGTDHAHTAAPCENCCAQCPWP